MTQLKGFLIALIASFICIALPVTAQPEGSPGTPMIDSAAEQHRVNINTDSAERLALILKGVGMKRAQAIVEYRKLNGPFSDVSQLQQIKGIGEAIIEKNRDKITL
ncbi:MAG: ComEA family DNA-binding protein [Pseudomonadales bacterium]|jgi:competence protein ComEA